MGADAHCLNDFVPDVRIDAGKSWLRTVDSKNSNLHR
jgi:hypothetical protein